MRTLYNRYHAYDDLGREVADFADKKAQEIIDFIKKKEAQINEELNFAETEVIVLQSIGCVFAEARLRHGIKIRKEEKDARFCQPII
jgi:hypothetical protein